MSDQTARPCIEKTVGAGAFSQRAPETWCGGVSSIDALVFAGLSMTQPASGINQT